MQVLSLVKLFLLTLCLSSTLQGSDLKITSEDTYQEHKKQFVELFESTKIRSFDATPMNGQSLSLEFKSFTRTDAKASIVMVHGFSENFVKYQEFIYDLYRNGYNVHIYNLRGHGRSSFDKQASVHVDRFECYVDDLEKFIEKISATDSLPKIGFAHSLGGGIMARYLQRGHRKLEMAFLSSPLIKMQTPPLPYSLVKIGAAVATNLSLGSTLAFGQSLPEDNWTLEDASTLSKLRFEHYKSNAFSDAYADMLRGGATYGFLHEVFQVSDRLLDPQQIAKIQVPILIFQAGQDQWVENDAQNIFCEFAKQCKLVQLDQARHEIYHEQDEFRIPFMTTLLSQLRSYLEMRK